MSDYIPIEDLVEGACYWVDGRNCSVAQWNGKSFDYWRYKWGLEYMDDELHWDSDPKYGTCKPLRRIE